MDPTCKVTPRIVLLPVRDVTKGKQMSREKEQKYSQLFAQKSFPVALIDLF